MNGRFRSLDLFRGLTVAAMIVVNNQGNWAAAWPPLRHAEWHGCTPTDLVFPFFLFAVGMSLWFSSEKSGHRLTVGGAKRIARRAVLLFLIGLFINAFPFFGKNWCHFRVFGILQRIGLAYAVAAFLCLGLDRKSLVWASLGILLGYFGLLWAWDPTQPFELLTNLPGDFDRWLIGEKHLFHGFRDAAGGRVAFDPEGFLATFPAAVTVVLGYLTGDLLASADEKIDQTSRNLIALGLGLLAFGAFWHLFFPLNKPLWSSSFVLFTGGAAILTVGFFFYVFDQKGWISGTGPLIHLGQNALFSFVFSMLLTKTLLAIKWPGQPGEVVQNGYDLIYEVLFRPIDEGGAWSSFVFSFAFLAVIWAACWVLYRRGIFIKI